METQVKQWKDRLAQFAGRIKSERGRAWFSFATHPPAGGRGAAEGVPDSDTSSTAVPVFYPQVTIPAPGSTNWNCLILWIPGNALVGVYWTWNVGGAAPSFGSPTGTIVPPGYNFANFNTDAIQWRTAAQSLTMELLTSEQFDSGQVTTAQFGMPAPNAVYNGTNIEDQYTVAGTGSVWPPTAGALLELSPDGATSRPAREGSFCVLRGQGGWTTFKKSDPPNSGVTLLYKSSASPNYYLGPAALAAMSEWNGAWMLVEGLNPATSVYLRGALGLEVRPAPGSALALTAHASPAYDPTAIEAFFQVYEGQPDSLPASANALGGVLSTLAGAALPALARAGRAAWGALFNAPSNNVGPNSMAAAASAGAVRAGGNGNTTSAAPQARKPRARRRGAAAIAAVQAPQVIRSAVNLAARAARRQARPPLFVAMPPSTQAAAVGQQLRQNQQALRMLKLMS